MSTAGLVLFAFWCFAVAVVGGLAGLVLGNIRLPAAIFLSAAAPAAAAGANIGISAVAAATAGLAHIRAGRVSWPLVRILLLPSAVGALLGGLLSDRLPADLLRVVIGVALLYFASAFLLRTPGPPSAGGSPTELRSALIGGAAIGFLGGVIGLILGSLRLPLLVGRLGVRPGRAVGTNMVVGVAVGVAGVAGHAPGGIDWRLFAVGAAASVPGALLGARLTGRLSDAALPRAIGAVLVVSGVGVLLQGIL